MRLKDSLKQIVRSELTKSGLLVSSKYRISTVLSVNSDGTCLASIDGATITATPLYPVVQGQEVMLAIGNRGKFSAIPTKPNAPVIETVHPPFFSGGALMRFCYDETGGFNGNSDPATFRFQDQNNASVYRLIASDLIGLGGIINQTYSFSPSGTNFCFSCIDTNGDAIIRAYSLGKKLVAAGTIDSINKIFTLSTKIIANTFIPTPVPSVEVIIADAAVTDDGVLYFLDYINSGTTFSNPALPDDSSPGSAAILETWMGAGFLNSLGLNASSSSSISPTYHIGTGGSTIVTFSGTTSWCSITASSGTISIFGLNGGNPVNYDHLLNINSSGLANGTYHATITATFTGQPNLTQQWDIYLAVNTTSVTYRLRKVLSNGAVQDIVHMSDPTLKYFGSTPQIRILEPTKNIIAALNANTHFLDIINMTGNNSTPYASLPCTLTSFGSNSILPAGNARRSIGINCIPSQISSGAVEVQEKVSDSSVSNSAFTNSISDLGFVTPDIVMLSNGKGFTFELRTGGSPGVPPTFRSRQVSTASPGVLTVASSNIQNISPGEPNPDAWRFFNTPDLNAHVGAAAFGVVQS